MTHAELIVETLRLAGEDPASPTFHTAANATVALNEALSLFSFLTLCVESTAPFTVSTRGFTPPSTQASYIAPLMVHRGTLRMFPASIEELGALSSTWRQDSAAPTRYMQGGWSRIGLWPSPDVAYVVTIRFARNAAALSADSDVPEIPAEFHRSLLEYSVPRIRILEGGDEFTKESSRLSRFFSAAKQQAQFVQARARHMNYDTSPTERWFNLAEEKAWSMQRLK